MRIGDREICNGFSPYVIAEIGVNHEGSLSKAQKLIDMAVEGVAHAENNKLETVKIFKKCPFKDTYDWSN